MAQTNAFAELAFIESELEALLPILGDEDFDSRPGMIHRVSELWLRIVAFEKDVIRNHPPVESAERHAYFIPIWRKVEELKDRLSGVDGDGELMIPERLMARTPTQPEWYHRKKLFLALWDINGQMWLNEYYEPDEMLEPFYRFEKATLFDAQMARIRHKLSGFGIDPVLIHTAFAPYLEFRDHPELPFTYRQLTKLRKMMVDLAWWVDKEPGEKSDEQFPWLLGSLSLNSFRFLKYCKGWFFRRIVCQASFKAQAATVKEFIRFVRSFGSYDWNVYTDGMGLNSELGVG